VTVSPPRRLVLLLVIAFASGCAARQPPRDVVAESAVHLRAGCYRCLQEGLALLDKRLDLPSRQRAFELSVLLIARAKELGLPFEAWTRRATELAAALPPAAADFIALASALRLDPAGLDRDRDLAQRMVVVSHDVPRWLASIEASSASSETRMYFALAGNCGFFIREAREAAVGRVRAAASGVPLLEYALGACISTEEQWLVRAMEHEPRFDDAAYPLARYLFNRANVGTPSEIDVAKTFARARSAFPESAAITYTEATNFQLRRDWAHALEGFDATLKLQPAHHDARLGRVVALSMLERHDEAIGGATSLIGEGKWLVGDSYYWRAWNKYAQDQLDESERDIEQAKKHMRSGAVFVLSGLIQWRKQRPAVAEGEFEQAIRLDKNACDAANYLGGVRAELRKWQLAADAYAGAESCRDREVLGLRATLNELIARRASEAAIDSQQKSIAESEQRAAEMAYNRGVMLANAGDVATAQGHIERAGRHPTLQSKATDLLQRLRTRTPLK
jgi:tetratricopeptide (TPR) repeat protein